MHCTALHCTALNCPALHCTALHYTFTCNIFYCTTLHWHAILSTWLRYRKAIIFTSLNYTDISCTNLHWCKVYCLTIIFLTHSTLDNHALLYTVLSWSRMPCIELQYHCPVLNCTPLALHMVEIHIRNNWYKWVKTIFQVSLNGKNLPFHPHLHNICAFTTQLV